jgi:voltage-gated potassium channel
VATVPGKRAIGDPDLRDRLYELLEHDHLPHSVGSRFAQLIVAIIVLDVLAMILASVPEFDARFGWLFTSSKSAPSWRSRWNIWRGCGAWSDIRFAP